MASIASADRSASPEEVDYLSKLCDAAELSQRQKTAVIHAATEESGEDLPQYLDILKNSNLKYSLVTDLMAFAKSDGDYTADEQQIVEKIADMLGVDKHQASLLDEFSDKAGTADAPPEEMAKPDFLSALGLGDKMQQAGINGGGFLKGLLGIAAPLILSGMISRGRNRAGSGGGGGMFGGSGGMLGGGGGSILGSGGLGSLIGMLSGGRGMGSAGGMLGRVLGRRF